MKAPKIERGLSKAIFTWDDLVITVSHLRNFIKDDRVTGLIHIETTKKGWSPHLYQSSFNFLSSSTRTQIVNSLTKRYADFDWASIFEQLCYHVIKIIREGNPVEEISTADKIEPTKYLVEPLVLLNQPTVIFGDGGSGKSLLRTLIYVIAYLPMTENNLGLAPLEKSHKGLILDWETDRDEEAWRLKRIENGMGLPTLFLNYRNCSHVLADDIEEIQEAIDQCGAEFVIVDSLAGACGGDLTASEPATRFYNSLRGLKTTPLIIAHNPKGDGKKTIYGSALFEHRARSVWECKATGEVGEDEMKIALFHRKANNSKKHSPIGFKIIFKDSSIKFEKIDVGRTPEFDSDMSASHRITELLKMGEYTTPEMANELELPQNTVTQALGRLKKKGIVQSMGRTFSLKYDENMTT